MQILKWHKPWKTKRETEQSGNVEIKLISHSTCIILSVALLQEQNEVLMLIIMYQHFVIDAHMLCF